MLAIPKWKKENLEEKLTWLAWSGFTLHLSSPSFTRFPLEGAELPAVPALRVRLFADSGPRRLLGPGAETPEDSEPSLGVRAPLKGDLQLLGEVGTVRALHFRNGVSETPIRVF